jgi:hypothetical protein
MTTGIRTWTRRRSSFPEATAAALFRARQPVTSSPRQSEAHAEESPASTASGQEQLRQTPSASPIPRADRTALTGKRLTAAARPGQPVTTGNFNRDRTRAQTP